MDELWSDFEGPRSLSRYLSVADDGAPAASLLARRVEADFDPSDDLKGLWSSHAEAAVRLERLIREGPSLEEGASLRPPEISLLDLKAEIARRLEESCVLCHHACGVDRTEEGTGICGVPDEAIVYSETLHLGEEPELVPSHAVFFGGCTLSCVFCQNWATARLRGHYTRTSPEDLVEAIRLKRLNGSRNVNWVGGDPSPHLPSVLEVLSALEVNVPSVWNSNMYASRPSMELLSGTQDLFLADLKYGNDECGSELSGVVEYTSTVHRNLLLASEGAGLIVRHLVMPGHLECCTAPALNWVSENLGPDTRVNVMFQYRPEHRAHDHQGINRRLTAGERSRALELVEDAGLTGLV
ncbi:MAG: hypothetical protein MAG715_00292 [Methanonatronarchaeales archaeon]|nr:hypothetical protein [Methanonatronarchaeales archaeon]